MKFDSMLSAPLECARRMNVSTPTFYFYLLGNW